MRRIRKDEIYNHFLSKAYPEPNTGCWLWSGFLYDGYGFLKLGGKITRSHRVSYLLHKGEIAKGLYVLHTCDVRCCVNPDHLFLGTHQDNMNDMIKKGRAVHPLKNRNNLNNK